MFNALYLRSFFTRRARGPDMRDAARNRGLHLHVNLCKIPACCCSCMDAVRTSIGGASSRLTWRVISLWRERRLNRSAGLCLGGLAAHPIEEPQEQRPAAPPSGVQQEADDKQHDHVR